MEATVRNVIQEVCFTKRYVWFPHTSTIVAGILCWAPISDTVAVTTPRTTLWQNKEVVTIYIFARSTICTRYSIGAVIHQGVTEVVETVPPSFLIGARFVLPHTKPFIPAIVDVAVPFRTDFPNLVTVAGILLLMVSADGAFVYETV